MLSCIRTLENEHAFRFRLLDVQQHPKKETMKNTHTNMVHSYS